MSGSNMTRKHVNVEPQRWYYWADRLGLLVWQDMPCGDNRTPESKVEFERELDRLIATHRQHPTKRNNSDCSMRDPPGDLAADLGLGPLRVLPANPRRDQLPRHRKHPAGHLQAFAAALVPEDFDHRIVDHLDPRWIKPAGFLPFHDGMIACSWSEPTQPDGRINAQG